MLGFGKLKIGGLALISALAVSVSLAYSASFTGMNYKAADLLSPCQESDNDARWGEAAETECEQYILGFVDALAEVGATGSQTGICPPATNTADEVRWAFMRWVHADFTNRRAMPAADALLATLKDSFTCPE